MTDTGLEANTIEPKIRKRYWLLLGAFAGSIVTFVGCVLVVAVV